MLEEKVKEKELFLEWFPAGDGEVESQDGWIDYWNNTYGESWLPSAADYYKIFKQLYRDLKDRASKKVAKMHIKDIRRDLASGLLATSTRIVFNPDDSLEAVIIHNYNSNKVEQTEERIVSSSSSGPLHCHINSFPCYLKYGLLYDGLDTEDLEFLQKLLGTSDSKEKILDVLSKVSGRRKSRLTIWMPDNTDDKYIDRPAWFTYCLDNSFVIYINENQGIKHHGISRGCRFCI